MSLRPSGAAARPPDPHAEHRRAFDHEHTTAYDAIEKAAQRLELVGPEHAREVALLRAMRRRLARHVNAGSCSGD